MATADRYRVLLVDDHAMFRDALRAALAQFADVEVIGDAGVAQATDRARTLRPDVVLVGEGLDSHGAPTAAELRRELPTVKVVVMGAGGDDPRSVYGAIRAGATGYVPKTHGVDELVGAIRLVAQGQAALPVPSLTRLVDFITGDVHMAAPPHPSDALSAREHDVLALVAQGKSNKEIADALCISESTARSHLHHILGKLGLANRVQAAAFALGHGPRLLAVSRAG